MVGLGRFWKVLEVLGRFLKVLEVPSRLGKVLDSCGRFWLVCLRCFLESVRRRWKVLVGFGTARKVSERFWKLLLDCLGFW